jgi:hypothetical protein
MPEPAFAAALVDDLVDAPAEIGPQRHGQLAVL